MNSRTCIGCGLKSENSFMIRYRLTSDFKLTKSLSSPGRGGWIHDNKNCHELALKSKRWYLALKTPLNQIDLSLVKDYS